MFRKAAITLVVFVLVAACVLGAGFVARSEVALPQRIVSDSACPATGCANGSCHGFDSVPQPDGVSVLTCPEAGCADVTCHGWEVLMEGYHQASDASLNVWVLAPVLLVVVLVLLVRKL